MRSWKDTSMRAAAQVTHLPLCNTGSSFLEEEMHLTSSCAGFVFIMCMSTVLPEGKSP